MIQQRKTYVDVEVSIVNVETMDSLLKVHMTHSICAYVVVVNQAELSTKRVVLAFRLHSMGTYVEQTSTRPSLPS